MTDTTNAPTDGIGALLGKRRTRSTMVPPSNRGPLQVTPDAPAAPPADTPDTTVGESTPPAPAPTPAPATVQQPTRPRPNPPRPKTTTAPAANGMRSTTVNMPQEIFARFDADRKIRRARTVDVLLDAIAAHEKNLTNLILDRRPALETGGLFPGRVVEEARPTERQTAGDNVTVYVKLPAAHLEAIDGLVAKADITRAATRPTELAVTRSELIVAALDAHLPAAPRRRRS